MGISTSEFWDDKYREGRTGWDIGYASPALMHHCSEVSTQTAILIPGAGNAHEWIALKALGFKDVTVLDISKLPIEALRLAYPDQVDQIVLGDFFNHTKRYDLILEQTFFCALDPSMRSEYLRKAHDLLEINGQLVGLLFDRNFSDDGPPFGGSIEEYTELFSAHFDSFEIRPCLNSIPERMGSEAFFVATRHL